MTGLASIILQSPGTLGLNTQAKDDVQDQRFCTIADNCIIDRSGRLAARNGWAKINSVAATGAPELDVVHSYLNSSGTEQIVSTGANKIWTGSTTLTDSTGSLTITADLWQFANFAGNVVGFQNLHEPIWWDGTGNFEYLVDQHTAWTANTAVTTSSYVRPTTRNGHYYQCTTGGTTHATTEPVWPTTDGQTIVDNTATWTCRSIPKGNACLSAFGRIWTIDADGKTVHYSDLLIPYIYHGGSAGSINLQSVWTGGQDTIIALSVHNNNLIIFCNKSIVIYSSADNVSNIALADVINATGCIARDSVQDIGVDLLFLSSGGVRSLGRTVIQSSLPMTDVSYNVREDLALSISGETVSLIRSTYNERLGIYLLVFPTTNELYCFNVSAIQQNIVRITTWSSINPTTVCTRKNGNLIFGFPAGFLGIYSTYQDNGTAYILSYKSGWIDVGLNTNKAIWKEMIAYFGSELDVSSNILWSFDFSSMERSLAKTVSGGDVSEYGIAEYGIAEYGSQTASQTIKYPLSGTGSVIRVGISASINNGNIAFNKIELYFKSGKNKP